MVVNDTDQDLLIFDNLRDESPAGVEAGNERFITTSHCVMYVRAEKRNGAVIAELDELCKDQAWTIRGLNDSTVEDD